MQSPSAWAGESMAAWFSHLNYNFCSLFTKGYEYTVAELCLL